MQPKFKQGDLVRLNHHNEPHIGVVMKTDGRLLSIDVFLSHRISTIRDYECVEPISPTTAFLTELQNLLRKYDARIFATENLDISHKKLGDIVGFYIGDDIEVFPTTFSTITPDNIFDYEK